MRQRETGLPNRFRKKATKKDQVEAWGGIRVSRKTTRGLKRRDDSCMKGRKSESRCSRGGHEKTRRQGPNLIATEQGPTVSERFYAAGGGPRIRKERRQKSLGNFPATRENERKGRSNKDKTPKVHRNLYKKRRDRQGPPMERRRASALEILSLAPNYRRSRSGPSTVEWAPGKNQVPLV